MSRFLKACGGEPVDATPVWFMRQAGRYMPEYRKIRKDHGMLEICKTPELAAEVTLQPVERFEVDAAILFADILLPLEPLGAGLEFVTGDGPVIPRPVRSRQDLERLRRVDVKTDLGFLAESVRLVRKRLDGRVPLIGFAGAPFTLACYLVEGGQSRHFVETKRLMHGEPEVWSEMLARLVDVTAANLRMQVEAGAEAVQVFDSWVGVLSPADYRRHVAPHVVRLFRELEPLGVPRIHFGTQTGALLEDMRDAGGNVIGVDWRIDLDRAWDRLGSEVAVQGNLDPVLLFAPRAEWQRACREILRSVSGRRGHVFNLGHGILPETPVEAVADLARFVHEESAGLAAHAGT